MWAGDLRCHVVDEPRLLKCFRRTPLAHQSVAPVDERLTVVQRQGAISGSFFRDVCAVAASTLPGSSLIR